MNLIFYLQNITWKIINSYNDKLVVHENDPLTEKHRIFQ